DHQDVKPDNILIEERGRARLINFGLAWFRPAWGGTDPLGGTRGTLAYLPPEQVHGREFTARSDIFALGGVVYFLLTGEAPYSGSNIPTVLRRVRACEWDRSLLNRPGEAATGAVPGALAQLPGARRRGVPTPVNPKSSEWFAATQPR